MDSFVGAAVSSHICRDHTVHRSHIGLEARPGRNVDYRSRCLVKAVAGVGFWQAGENERPLERTEEGAAYQMKT